MAEQRRPNVFLALVIVLGSLVMLVVLGTPLLLVAIQAMTEAARKEQAKNNLAQLRIALENYHGQRESPIADEENEAKLSHSSEGIPDNSLQVPINRGESKEEAMEKARRKLALQVEESGLSRIRNDLEKEIQPSIRLCTQASDDQHIEVGASKLGGVPDLPEGTEWPHWNEIPLAFIAQINMSDVEKHDVAGVLPQRGLLSFFYDAHQETWGFDPGDRGSWRVLFFEDKATLRRAQPPMDLPEHAAFTPCTLKCTTELTLPPWESICVEPLNLTDKEVDSYIQLLDNLRGEDAPVHQLLGHPDPIQGEMQLQCQLTFHGLYTGNPSGYEDPKVAELEPGATDWQLLLQIDSDEENAGMIWGDVGRLYFWIRKDDLKRRSFENVWMVLQCY